MDVKHEAFFCVCEEGKYALSTVMKKGGGGIIQNDNSSPKTLEQLKKFSFN